MTTPPSPPRRGRGRPGGDQTRERLARAALELFTTEGFRGTTTALIAARAGIAEGTIYRHFRGKEELFAELRRRALTWATELVGATEDAERPPVPRDQLQRIGRALIEGAHRDPAQLRLVLGGRGDPPLDAAGADRDRAFREALQRVIAAGKSDGAVRAGPAELWAAVWLSLVGFAAVRVASREWPPDHPSVGLVLDAAWEAISTP